MHSISYTAFPFAQNVKKKKVIITPATLLHLSLYLIACLSFIFDSRFTS